MQEENLNLLTFQEKNLIENNNKRIEVFRFKKEKSITHQNSKDKFFVLEINKNDEIADEPKN